MNKGIEHQLHHPKFCRNLCRKIQIADTQENHIDKSRQAPKSAGPIFDQSDDSIQAFGFGICDGFLDKGQNAMQMFSEHFDESSDRFEAAL